MNPQDWIGTWRLDPSRTELAFHSPTFWGLAHVKGVFTDIEGSADAAADDQRHGPARDRRGIGEHRYRPTRQAPALG